MENESTIRSRDEWAIETLANFPDFFDITRKGNDVTIKLKDEIWKDGDPHNKTEAIKIFMDFENQGDQRLDDLVSDLQLEWYIDNLEEKGWNYNPFRLGGYIKTMMIPEPLTTRLINSVHSKDILIVPAIAMRTMRLWE